MVIIKDISYLNRIIPSEYRVCTSYTWILIVIMNRCMAGSIYALRLETLSLLLCIYLVETLTLQLLSICGFYSSIKLLELWEKFLHSPILL